MWFEQDQEGQDREEVGGTAEDIVLPLTSCHISSAQKCVPPTPHFTTTLPFLSQASHHWTGLQGAKKPWPLEPRHSLLDHTFWGPGTLELPTPKVSSQRSISACFFPGPILWRTKWPSSVHTPRPEAGGGMWGWVRHTFSHLPTWEGARHQKRKGYMENQRAQCLVLLAGWHSGAQYWGIWVLNSNLAWHVTVKLHLPTKEDRIFYITLCSFISHFKFWT